jgi:hypothetical protein
MDNGSMIKLEMAQMAIRGGRFDEGEKMIQELIFGNLLDQESLSIAWFSYGSSKLKRFVQDQASFEEFIYAMNKSYSADPSSAQTISNTFVGLTCALIQNYSTTLYSCLEKLKQLNKDASLNKIKLIGGVIIGSVLDDRNKFLKYSAYTYSAVKGLEIIGNSLSNKSVQEQIAYCTLKIKQILNEIISIDPEIRKFNSTILDDEIINNKSIQFILESQNPDSISDKLLNFKNSILPHDKNDAGIVEPDEVISKMNSSSLLSKVNPDHMISATSRYKHLVDSNETILFGIKFKRGDFPITSGFFIFLKNTFVAYHWTNGLKPKFFIHKIPYSSLNIGDISVQDGLIKTNLVLRYNGETVEYSCSKHMKALNEVFSI